MILRRYYPKGFKGKTYSEEYLAELREQGVPTDRIDNAKHELLLSKEEQQQMFQQSCDMVLNHTRYVLDHLDNLIEYKVNWESYRKKS